MYSFATSTPEAKQILLKQAVDVAKKASHIVMQHYHQAHALEINTKTDTSPVTEADLASHHVILNGLTLIDARIPVLSEESTDVSERHSWATFWLVDPLDGTKEFIKRTDEFTVNIALIENGLVVMSILAVPVTGVIYAVIKDQPLYRIQSATSHDTTQWQIISPQSHVKTPEEMDVCRVSISRNIQPSEQLLYDAFFEKIIAQGKQYSLVEAGSAYKFCTMAEGLVDVYPRFHPTSEWDTASGQGILEALGGNIFDLKGRPFIYNQRDTLLNGQFMAVTSSTNLGFYLD